MPTHSLVGLFDDLRIGGLALRIPLFLLDSHTVSVGVLEKLSENRFFRFFDPNTLVRVLRPFGPLAGSCVETIAPTFANQLTCLTHRSQSQNPTATIYGLRSLSS